MRPTPQIVLRGLGAGFAGATVLVLWFLVIDAVQGQPFHTPAFLASVLAGVDGVDRSVGLILMYTALHYAAFFAIGVVVAWAMSRLETAPTLLLGLVLGFLLFDSIFYFGIVFTGVDVVREFGWAELLAGNLLAGTTILGVLHLSGEAPSVTWWQSLAEHRIVREGIVAGALGAVAVAAWFLIVDAWRGQVFFTPGALGSALFLGASDLASVQVSWATVAGYTVAHVAAFVAVGIVAAAICVQCEETPSVLLGALLLFVSFEAFFLGALAVLAEWLLGAVAWWAIAGGNLIATMAMALYLWKAHPKLQAALRDESWMEEKPEASKTPVPR
ncbi:MAG: hypothetical protein ACREKI_08620 [Gemmatimonadota bacterium]